MKFDVNIYVETTWKGPARRKGVAMWLVEYKRAGESITRQGMIHLDDGTETRPLSWPSRRLQRYSQKSAQSGYLLNVITF